MGTLVVTGSGENLEVVGPGASAASDWPPFWPWNMLRVSCPPVAASGEGGPGLQWVVVAAALAASEIADGGGGLLARQRPGWPPWAVGRWPWPSLQLAQALPMVGPAAALEPLPLPGWMSRSLSR